MNCFRHPVRAAVGACVNCGRSLCAECQEVLDGKIYCSSCAVGVVMETAEPSDLNWFERHLNWTMILAYFGAGAVIAIPAAISAATDSAVPLAVTAPIVVLAMFIVWGWALRKKNRSLLWLALFLILPFFGLLIFFYLENRGGASQPSQPPQNRRILH